MGKIPPGATEATCDGPNCGRRILWIVVDGKSLPVDPIRTRLYEHSSTGTWSVIDDELTDKPLLGYISHFRTCPDANTFTREKTRTPTRPDQSKATCDSQNP